METLSIEDLHFEVRRSERRRLVEVMVDREGELVIKAPERVPADVLRGFAREKRSWIYQKLAEKAALRRPTGPKEFVTGEGFLYLGRSYRLLLVEKQEKGLKFEGGRFHLLRSEARDGRVHFIRWYIEHGHLWLGQRVGQWAPRLGVKVLGVRVRDLGYRWGSCGRRVTVHFHWAAILLPPSIVDYVIVHELAHISEPNHTPAFWRLVARAMPGYEERKQWLAEHGASYVAI